MLDRICQEEGFPNSERVEAEEGDGARTKGVRRELVLRGRPVRGATPLPTWLSRPDTPRESPRIRAPVSRPLSRKHSDSRERKNHATRTKKFVKLAPFKLRLSKMLKSRSSGDSRSNSVESEEQQRQINQSLPSGTDEFADAPEAETDKNCLSVRNEQTIPSSPPPSYEHVLEETRMESSAIALREAKEGDKEKHISSNEKSTEEAEGDDAGDDGSGGPGGGDRKAAKGPKILHKSSKEFYKAMAKQWGITCKMSDHCRCLDCQSHYFDCDYEKDEQEKGDGGLSAGTPMFISEVMHGTACALL